MAAPLTLPLSPALDSNANPLNGAKLYAHLTGSTTPATIYTTSSRATPHPYPLPASSDGKFPQVFLDPAVTYRFVVKDASGNTIPGYDFDPVATPAQLTDLLASAGASLIGFKQSGVGATTRTAEDKLREVVSVKDYGAVGDGVTNDTAAFAAAAAQYALGRSISIPNGDYLIDADTFNLVPPSSYNAANKRAPDIICGDSVIIRGRTSGTYLVKLGSTASDYSGYLRNACINLPVLHDGGKTFTKAVLYAPFFIDVHFNYRVVVTAATRGAWFGDTTAPGPSAGLKSTRRDYDRDLGATARTVQSITNASNPVVTFASAHNLWPTSGSRCVCINFTGTLGSWAAINNTSLDAVVLSSTQIQLMNVNTTAYGAFPGGTAYLNMASVRIPKQIAGVTNANPCVITTTVPHLLTSGNTVDIAEIFGMPNLVGQYTATVLTATTFSIPVDTTSTATWGAWVSFGPGWAMQWVPLNQCDIAEYHDNCTDVDSLNVFSRHFRIHQYHNPATCGYDGKHVANHFYNFPEAGEALCGFYLGGDNNCFGNQMDGPFRYMFWTFGPRNASCGNSTNVYIMARNQAGALVRTESGAAWSAYMERLKAAGNQLFTDHVGLGTFECDRMIYSNVAAPQVTQGSRRQGAAVRFTGASGAIQTQLQVTAVTRSSAGVYKVDFARPVPLTAPFYGTAGTPNAVVSENEAAGGRSTTTRYVNCHVAGVLTDPASVSVEWMFP